VHRVKKLGTVALNYAAIYILDKTLVSRVTSNENYSQNQTNTVLESHIQQIRTIWARSERPLQI
jgi:hypothetical protein